MKRSPTRIASTFRNDSVVEAARLTNSIAVEITRSKITQRRCPKTQDSRAPRFFPFGPRDYCLVNRRSDNSHHFKEAISEGL